MYNSTDTSKFLYAGASSDFLNLGLTNGGTISNNWVGGTNLGINPTACGIIADYKVNTAHVTNNVVSDVYNCGIGVGGGNNYTISGNKVLITNGNGSSAGISINGSYYSPLACYTITISNNIAYAKQTSGWVQGYWSDGYCTGISLSGNTFDVGCTVPNCAGYNMLYPMTTTNPPPLIPPQPKKCVLKSPYSTQTSMTSCSP